MNKVSEDGHILNLQVHPLIQGIQDDPILIHSFLSRIVMVI